ncbi:acyl-CoA dehydrogenase family protein [Myxococcota bacterium]|nr:acyl-CoA dehydrogenase family protein [Myxococcota bacterium]
MANFYSDNDDFKFYVERGGIDWPTLIKAVELNYKATEAPADWTEAHETYKEILDMAGNFIADEIAPKAAQIEKEGVHFVDGKVVTGDTQNAIFDQLKELGLYGLAVPRELGGFNAPTTLYFLIGEMFCRADPGLMTHFGFHAGFVTVLMRYALADDRTTVDEYGNIIESPWTEYIQEIMAGEAWGAMDLTEADAGSDLAALRTKAVKDADGTWRINGSKVFITSGHGKYHLVLAKTEDKYSLKALSLFMVPLTLEKDGETITNGSVDRIEEKIGHHSSATCSMQYENSEGYLIGKEGDGFKQMLLLMNNARIGVGFEAIGAMEEAFRMATQYAEERTSWGKPIAQHEMVADYLAEMDIVTKGMRAMAVEGAFSEEMANRLEQILGSGAQLNGETKEYTRTQKRYARRSRYITPLLKYSAAEWGVWVARMNMQIHGGSGYTTEYGAERILRDTLVTPVYEGTSQIQALMAFKDAMGLALKNPQRFLSKATKAKINAATSFDPLTRRFHAMESLSYSAQQHILLRIAKEKWSDAASGPLTGFFDKFLKEWDPKKDFAFGLLHAERLTRILSDVLIAEILLEQSEKHPERRILAERWIERAEPRVRYNWDMIHNLGDRVLSRLYGDETNDESDSPFAETQQ